MTCNLLHPEIDEAVSLMSKLYFKDGDKLHTPSFLEESLHLRYLEEYPQYVALKKRIYADLHKMGNEAITSLKEKGIWRDEQAIGN